MAGEIGDGGRTQSRKGTRYCCSQAAAGRIHYDQVRLGSGQRSVRGPSLIFAPGQVLLRCGLNPPSSNGHIGFKAIGCYLSNLNRNSLTDATPRGCPKPTPACLKLNPPASAPAL